MLLFFMSFKFGTGKESFGGPLKVMIHLYVKNRLKSIWQNKVCTLEKIS